MQRWQSVEREAGLPGLASQAAWWATARSYMLIYHRLHPRGREHLPAQPPFVIAANHQSHLDALAVGASLPIRLRRCVLPIAAGDTFFEAPPLALFAASCLNALPLWRANVGRHALGQLRQRLIGEPCGFILFPEGTRSRSGIMGRFKAGLGMLIAGTQVPVVPCRISGAHRALPPDRSIARPKRIHVQFGEPLHFTDVPNSKDGWQQITARTEQAVNALG